MFPIHKKKVMPCGNTWKRTTSIPNTENLQSESQVSNIFPLLILESILGKLTTHEEILITGIAQEFRHLWMLKGKCVLILALSTEAY